MTGKRVDYMANMDLPKEGKWTIRVIIYKINKHLSTEEYDYFDIDERFHLNVAEFVSWTILQQYKGKNIGLKSQRFGFTILVKTYRTLENDKIQPLETEIYTYSCEHYHVNYEDETYKPFDLKEFNRYGHTI